MTFTGLSAIIRQKSHVLEHFSISVNNKILTFSERLKKRRTPPLENIENITHFRGVRQQLSDTLRYKGKLNGIWGFKTLIFNHFCRCFRQACQFLDRLLVFSSYFAIYYDVSSPAKLARFSCVQNNAVQSYGIR